MATEVVMPASASSSGGNRSWENVNSIYDTSETFAKVVLNRSSHVADTLRGTFKSIQIDPEAVITGLEVRVSRGQSGNFEVLDKKATFVVGGVPIGQDKAKLDKWGNTMEVMVYGGSDDLWGLDVGDLYDADNKFFNSFQFGYGAESPSGKTDPVELYIQYMQLTIYYEKDGIRFRQDGVFKPAKVSLRIDGSWVKSEEHYIRSRNKWEKISFG